MQSLNASKQRSSRGHKHYSHVVFRAVENRVAMIKADVGHDSAMRRGNRVKLRVWAEFITPREASAPAVVALLERYRVDPCIAVPRGSLGAGYADFLKAYRAAGLEPALWPTLNDDLGYWPHEGNALEFSAYVEEIFHWAQKEGVKIPWLAVDLETPIYQWREINNSTPLRRPLTAWRTFRSNRNRTRFTEAAAVYRELQDYLGRQGCRTLVPVIPFIEPDLRGGRTKLQDYLETPVTPINWDVISVMQYNSMFAGYSKGLIKPADAVWHLYRLCLNFKQAFGPRAALSVGTTGTGKLGDEPFYRDPAEMQPDVAAALAAGIDDIAVFCLEGILHAARPEAWFEMLRSTIPHLPPRSKKMDLLRFAGALCYRLLP